MWRTLQALAFDRRTLLVLYVFAAIFVSVQLVLLGTHAFIMPKPGNIPGDIMNQPQYMNLFLGRRLTEYNNYVIFRYSWFHLLHGTNLYGIYPTQYWDFYKYSPTFALFMGLLAYLPDVVGLSAWNLLNVLAVYYAIRLLPFNNKALCLLLWFIGNELITSLSNTQSNGLMCGLMIAAFGCMQQGKMMWAALWLMVATYIKVYGIIGCCLFLFYPGKLKFILYAILWTVILAVLPLSVTPFHTLVWQYHNWVALMIADASEATGLSVTGWLSAWFGFASSYSKYITLMGVALFLLPFVKFRLYQNELYRLLTLAAMLLWVIIFNHKAESPTYIIAVAGVGIWYFAMPRAAWRTALLVFVLIFTSLSTTDFFPLSVRVSFIMPYKIKAFPCIVAWIVVFTELMLLKPASKLAPGNKVLAVN